MLMVILTEPLAELVEELRLPERLELGPFDNVTYEDGYFCGDGERVAQIFKETVDDMMSSPLGHPAAGYVFAPRTFHMQEQDDPEYPGKPYNKLTIIPTVLGEVPA